MIAVGGDRCEGRMNRSREPISMLHVITVPSFITRRNVTSLLCLRVAAFVPIDARREET